MYTNPNLNTNVRPGQTLSNVNSPNIFAPQIPVTSVTGPHGVAPLGHNIPNVINSTFGQTQNLVPQSNLSNRWNNPYGRNIAMINFNPSCRKCKGTGVHVSRLSGTAYPCKECYSSQGYCTKCYGSGMMFKKDKVCNRCQSGRRSYTNATSSQYASNLSNTNLARTPVVTGVVPNTTITNNIPVNGIPVTANSNVINTAPVSKTEYIPTTVPVTKTEYVPVQRTYNVPTSIPVTTTTTTKIVETPVIQNVAKTVNVAQTVNVAKTVPVATTTPVVTRVPVTQTVTTNVQAHLGQATQVVGQSMQSVGAPVNHQVIGATQQIVGATQQVVGTNLGVPNAYLGQNTLARNSSFSSNSSVERRGVF